MARPVTITKERILSAALDLVRSGGPAALTARNLCRALGCGLNPIFSSFGSIGGVMDAVKEEARDLYRRRVGAGFSMNPPFKGFGVALLWFAIDEPHLYSLVTESDKHAQTIESYIDTSIGFKQESLDAIAASFGLEGQDAEMLYYHMVLMALGLAQACTRGGCALSIPQVSEIFGKNVRAFLMVIRAGTDNREKYIPQAGAGPRGGLDSYVLMRTLAGQNHLLEQLHASPRYIQDHEWAELERVFRNSYNLTPESLREANPGL
ncbi:MAG: TetR/AcrR family transcriptional regulator, partial [Bacteroidales bacterium]|nr:TetR/AcrR family transcriptional regulator [Bacteroidales bacterium]